MSLIFRMRRNGPGQEQGLGDEDQRWRHVLRRFEMTDLAGDLEVACRGDPAAELTLDQPTQVVQVRCRLLSTVFSGKWSVEEERAIDADIAVTDSCHHRRLAARYEDYQGQGRERVRGLTQWRHLHRLH